MDLRSNISILSLSFTRGSVDRGGRRVLDGVNFSVEQGEVFAVAQKQ